MVLIKSRTAERRFVFVLAGLVSRGLKRPCARQKIPDTRQEVKPASQPQFNASRLKSGYGPTQYIPQRQEGM